MGVSGAARTCCYRTKLLQYPVLPPEAPTPYTAYPHILVLFFLVPDYCSPSVISYVPSFFPRLLFVIVARCHFLALLARSASGFSLTTPSLFCCPCSKRLGQLPTSVIRQSAEA